MINVKTLVRVVKLGIFVLLVDKIITYQITNAFNNVEEDFILVTKMFVKNAILLVNSALE